MGQCFGEQSYRTGRRIGQLGQYEVDDVLGEIVLTTGNEDLGAADLVRSVRLRLGLGANDAQIGTCVWLGQAIRISALPFLPSPLR